jgi:hypothetical protein
MTENATQSNPTADVTESTQGLGGRTTTGEPEASRNTPVNSDNSTEQATTDERYKRDAIDPSRVVAARDAVGGRMKLVSAFSDNGFETTGSAIWRAENNKVHPDEVDKLDKALIKVEADIKAGKYNSAKKDSGNKGRISTLLTAGFEAYKLVKEIERINKAKSVMPLVAATLQHLDQFLPAEPTSK